MDEPNAKPDIKPELEEEKSTSAIILAALLVAVAAGALLYGLQSLIYVSAWSWGRSNPALYEVPQSLPPPAVPAAPGTKLSYYGFEFDVPWKGDAKSDDSSGPYTRLRFPAGEVVVFFDPAGMASALGSLKSAAPAQYMQLVGVFGEHPFASNAALYDEVYRASPAQVSPLMERRTALRLNVLLLWKLAFGESSRSGIYSFDWSRLHGLQFGNPEKSPSVTVRLFDEHDREFRFLFTTAAGSGAKLTQADISQIVNSLRPVAIKEK